MVMTVEKRVLERVADFPTIAPVAVRLNELLVNQRTSAREVAELIASDPALVSRVLKIVNSAYFGFPNRISTVTHAVVILGFSAVRNIVLTSSIVDTLHQVRARGLNLQAHWVHSLACGAASRMLARRLAFPALEEFFIFGVLHDIGKVALASALGTDYGDVLQAARDERRPLTEVETATLGTNHAEIGSKLLERWHLPVTIVDSTKHHHNPEVATRPRAVAVVHVADAIAHAAFPNADQPGPLAEICPLAWETFGLAEPDLETLLASLVEETAHALVLLDLDRCTRAAHSGRWKIAR